LTTHHFDYHPQDDDQLIAITIVDKKNDMSIQQLIIHLFVAHEENRKNNPDPIPVPRPPSPKIPEPKGWNGLQRFGTPWPHALKWEWQLYYTSDDITEPPSNKHPSNKRPASDL